ncbi:hypothetical protein [Thalassomonas sp. RHCl1]|uniref:hypothetical protein n=1 Tax=Thalassomonas sp. RHCl1 TaxID=2995320 RepID=UPI00248CB69C|nr:hypothetical protein [Thalassomonas sp. RHCl1]
MNDEGQFRCFVVDNAKISRNGMTKIASAIPGVTITKSPRFFDDDVFCEFTYKGNSFTIEEPYGDNATYDVVAPEDSLVAFEEIATFFEEATAIKSRDWGYNIMFLLRTVIASLLFIGFIRWLSS